MTIPSLSIIILAAGKGTRMKSDLPKVFHKIANREMVNLVIDTSKELNPKNICVVISADMADLAKNLQKQHNNLEFVIQKERLGTAHAVQTAIDAMNDIGDNILVLYGDTPLLTKDTLENMISNLCDDQNTVSVLGFDCFSNNKYGRLIVENGKLEKIIEFKDASQREKEVTLCNSGVVAINGNQARELLGKVDNNNASGEYYLTDIVGIAKGDGKNCGFIKIDEQEVMGVNSKSDLAKAEKIKQDQLRNKFMEEGVTLIDPYTVYFSYDTQIKNDSVIYPNVFFGENVQIGQNVHIKSFSNIEGAKIEKDAVIGPFARLRPQSIIKEGVKIGNFVEIKKSKIEKESKVSHLSYIGDSEIGKGSNIGAGTITCNYDGYNKFSTKIGRNVFIGSNSSLIAPVHIKDDAVIGAGSVISKDVEKGDLAVARAKQIEIKKGGEKYHQKKNEK